MTKHEPVASPYVVPFDGSFRVEDTRKGKPKGAPGKKECKKRLGELVDELGSLQETLYADNRFSVLLVFQAMDAAGKDGAIRALLTGVNPAGCQVQAFGPPSAEELDHDFLWRTTRSLPERGRIGVFNRSYYEEVLVVRVHPEILEKQRLPYAGHDGIWQERFESIREHERHLARNGTVVLKFWLNVSRAEQRKRFLARIEEPEKNWKFKVSDVETAGVWPMYMHAYEETLNATSRPWAPWYAIPADDKPFARLCVAEVVVATMKRLDLHYPPPSHDVKELERMKSHLEKTDAAAKRKKKKKGVRTKTGS